MALAFLKGVDGEQVIGPMPAETCQTQSYYWQEGKLYFSPSEINCYMMSHGVSAGFPRMTGHFLSDSPIAPEFDHRPSLQK